MAKPTLYEALNQYPRDVIREAEDAGFAPKGTLEEMIIYQEFLFWQTPERKRPKCEIYNALAERYGYSLSTIRRKITLMASTNFPPEYEADVKNYNLFLYLRYRHNHPEEFPSPDSNPEIIEK